MLSWFCLLVFFVLSPNFMGLSSGCELGMGKEGCRIISTTKGCHLIIKYCTYWAGHVLLGSSQVIFSVFVACDVALLSPLRRGTRVNLGFSM